MPKPAHVAEIDWLRSRLAVAVSTIEHLNNCLVGQADHDIALAADTELILRDLHASLVQTAKAE